MKTTNLKFLSAVVPFVALLGCTLAGNTSGGTAVVQVFQGTTEITAGGTYDFGSVQQGIQSTPVTFTIKNSGTAPVTLTGSGTLTITGSNSADFAISTPPGLTIAAGASTSFALVFTPSLLSSESVQISISSPLGAYTFNLTGTGTGGGTLQMKWDGDGFMNLPNGGTATLPSLFGSGSSIMTFQIINNDVTQPLVLVGATPLTMTNAFGAFSITTSPTSPVAPNGGTTLFVIQMDYIGTSPTETVTLKTSDPSNPTFTFSVTGFQS
jgi:hypothetical protein